MTAPGSAASSARTISQTRSQVAALAPARTATLAVTLLALVAAGVGLLLPGVYRDPAGIVNVMRGQDLLTLLTLPVLFAATSAALRGSSRGLIIWYGIVGYLLYTYATASVAYHLNALFLVYVALFSLTTMTLAYLVPGTRPERVRSSFDARTPTRAVAVFLVFVGVMNSLPELAQLASFWTTGEPPAIVTRAGTSTSVIHALDLGFILPLTIVSAVWLWRRLSWGYLLAGVSLIKCATMGSALLLMTLFDAVAGNPVEVGMTGVYAFIAAGGLVFSGLFLRGSRH